MTIQSDSGLRAAINAHGAELTSLSLNGTEHLWQADPAIWARHAPVLFPIVGKVFDGKYRADGNEYRMGQHGFARDREWEVVRHDVASIVLRLRSDADTLARYPYPFELQTEYRLDGNTLIKTDTVRNTGSRDLHYQIGNHPGFLYRDHHAEDRAHGYLQLLRGGKPLGRLQASMLNAEGYVAEGLQDMPLADGTIELTDRLFDNDALVLEHAQADSALLLDKQRRPYLRMDFAQAQVLGIWSPKGKRAPFVCIEPWNGRADRQGYRGDIAQRDWMQHLQPGQSQAFQCAITLI